MSWLFVLERIGTPLWEEALRHPMQDGTPPQCACLALEALAAMKAEGLLNERGLELLAPFDHQTAA